MQTKRRAEPWVGSCSKLSRSCLWTAKSGNAYSFVHTDASSAALPAEEAALDNREDSKPLEAETASAANAASQQTPASTVQQSPGWQQLVQQQLSLQAGVDPARYH